MKKIIAFAVISMLLFSCDVLNEASKNVKLPANLPLTDAEIVSGLKDALKIGTQGAVGFLSTPGTFYNDLSLRIPFPPEVSFVEQKLRQIGMNKLVDDFIVTMNKGAGEAVKEATPIFANAIAQMTFQDARSILKGPDNAATKYFKDKTSQQLYNLFKPKVQKTLDNVGVTKHWSELTGAYNKIPLVEKVETDLNRYVTNMAMDRLFTRIASEEKLIRTDPAKRVTDILKKVFGATNI
jgi:hypothetical protein